MNPQKELLWSLWVITGDSPYAVSMKQKDPDPSFQDPHPTLLEAIFKTWRLNPA